MAALNSINGASHPDSPPAGIAAARAAGMASVGVARLGDEALLRAVRADLVVASFDRVDTTAVPDDVLRARRATEMPAYA
jgi:beta-phosphoglucomutase-like phosphatase (HAD superfamily)